MKYFIVSIAAAVMAACNNTAGNDSSKEIAQAGPVDPVCEMAKDSTWTEYSVNKGDTTWFCSPHCKSQFDKDPAKYTKK